LSELLTYKDVPKGFRKNLAWRYWLRRKLVEKPEYRELIVRSCAADILFFINSFVWIFEQREKESRPFITWPFQDENILKLQKNIEGASSARGRQERFDIGWDKSRDMGATLSVLSVLDHYWRFVKNCKFLCISRIEDDVDKADDDKTLFRKLDFFEERMPPALAVRGAKHDAHHGRAFLKIHNRKTRSTITGEPSGPDAGRGGRYLAVFRDEEAAAKSGFKISSSLMSTTRCQIRVSTPQGVGGSFYTAKTKGGIDWITTHWTLHPEKREGLYSVEGEQIKVLDEKWHREHPGYPFKELGAPTYADPGTSWEFLRSPWFDAQDDAADSVADIAQEHQISYLGSGSPYFRPDKVAEARAHNAANALEVGQIGDFVEIGEMSDLDPRRDKCKLWFQRIPVSTVTKRGKSETNMGPPQSTTYTLGIDVAAGTGASDSVISVGDDTSCRKVFEFRTNGLTPSKFARVALAVYKYFSTTAGTAFIAWDAPGHGAPFGAWISEHGDALCYYHKKVSGKPSAVPGVFSNAVIKREIFSEYMAALFEGRFVTPSREAYEQANQFVHDGAEGVIHQKSKAANADKSAVGKQHGDVVTSEVILWLAMRERPAPVAPERYIAVGSPAWYAERRKEARVRPSMFDL